MIDISNQGLLADRIRENPHASYLLIFPHGLGDVLNAYPCIESLKALFPKTRIDVALKESNQSLKLHTADMKYSYDFKFVANYYIPSVKFKPLTKNQLFCKMELGIDPPEDLFYKKSLGTFTSPIVTLGFHSYCFPVEQGCPLQVAENIAKGVKDAGFLPLLLKFENNVKLIEPYNYSKYIKASTEDCVSNFNNLFGLIERSYAFIGVLGGPMWAAFNLLGPNRCLCLEHMRNCSWKHYPDSEKQFIYQFDITAEKVKEWLLNLKKTDQS